ncbi:MAG: cysteine desulfurase family protein, partial [Clostridia bacterium]|nr:cysteine desulfurase family protein [Clostridia bacterium]
MRVYLDHAATTPLDEEVLQKMMPYLTEKFGNTHSQHSFGKETAIAVDKARKQVADALNCNPNEIYFTGSGTESDNWAIKGAAFARRDNGKHIIVSAIEHHAIINSAKWLGKNGFDVTYLSVDKYGVIKLDELKKAIRPDTILVSVMLANNEVGTIEPIKEVVEICHAKGILVHSDCVQAVGAVEIDLKELGVDLASVSAHKFYGPKGVGALYIKNGVKIDKLIVGGGQERMQRGGTTNTPAIVGMGEAIQKAVRDMQKNNAYIKELRDYFVKRVTEEIPYVTYNGHPTVRLPSNANFSFEFIEGEGILMLLDLGGVAVSSGSACSSGTLDPSHVLLAMGVDIVLAHGSLRF